MSDMIRATLSAEGTLSGNVSPVASVAGNLTQGPIIFNDFVIDLEEVPEGVLLTVRKGSDVQTALIPMGEGTGKPGADGGYYSVGVSQTSADKLQFRFTPSKEGMATADPVTVTLPAGPKGDAGEPGKDGPAGTDGISPTVSVSKSGKVTTISITDKNGAKTATVNDGADGQPGKDGSNGTSVTVKSVSTSSADGGSNVVTFSDGKTITIKNGSKGSTGATGATGATGPKGPQGADGAAGKTAYQYAQDGGYTGTEKEFATKLAEQAVSTAPQTLTDTQKAQARTNIGAVQGWKELKDKPVTVYGGDTLTWDGNTDGLVYVEAASLYKVSDAVPTIDDLSEGMIGTSGDLVITFHFTEATNGLLVNETGSVAIVSSAGVEFNGVCFPETGTYMNLAACNPGDFFTIPGYTGFGKEVLKPDILPKALQFGDYPTGGDTLTWDGNTDGKRGVSISAFGMTFTYYHVSDAVPTESDVMGNAGVKLGSSDGLVYGYDELLLGFEEDGSAIIQFMAYIVPHDDYVADTDGGPVTFDKKGVYFAGTESGYTSFFTIPGYTGFPSTKTLDAKYLPEHLQFGDVPFEYLPETTVQGVDDGSDTGTYTVQLDATQIPSALSKADITFDGVKYALDAVDAAQFVCFGNMKFMGGLDTGEPFALAIMPGMIAMLATDNGEAHRVSVTVYEAKKISQKYCEAPMTMFYVNMGESEPYYLYKDLRCTTKAERIDVTTALVRKPVILNATDIYYFTPTAVQVMSTYVIVHASLPGDNDRMFHTAEYTPT